MNNNYKIKREIIAFLVFLFYLCTILRKILYLHKKWITIEGLVTSLYPQDYFDCFAWSQTIEGYDFWKQHYYRWVDKIEQMSYDYQDIFNTWQKIEIK